MCNINIIYRKTKKYSIPKLTNLINLMTDKSFQYNNDGEGYILTDSKNRVAVNKDRHKITYELIDNIKLIATHQRKSTSGFSNTNIHPHESKDFFLIHNGVFTGLGDLNISDSRVYLELLQNSFDKEQNIVAAIQKTNKEIGGSYSVAIYHKDSGRTYYYKNDSTSMWAIDIGGVLIMTTRGKNFDYVRRVLGIKTKAFEVPSEIIFEINDNGLIKIGRFEETHPWFNKKLIKLKKKEIGQHYDMWRGWL